MSGEYNKSIKYIISVDPILAKVAKIIPPLDFNAKFEDPFLSLTESIVSQQLSVKVSDVIFARLQSLFPNRTITPEAILEIKDQSIRDVGLSWAKISYIKDLAKKTLDREIKLDSINDLRDEEIINELTKVKGIGRWTVEMFLIFNLGRMDIFSFGDLGLSRAIQRLYGLNNLPTKEEAERISGVWKPYRSIASRYLWRSLEFDV